MPFEPKFEQINLTLKKGCLKEGVKVDCKTEIPSDGVSKLLNLSAKPNVLTTTQTPNGLECNGVVNFFVNYLDFENHVKKFECASEFFAQLTCPDGVEPDKTAIQINVEKTDADVSGVKVLLSAYLQIQTSSCQRKNLTALVGGDDLVLDNKEITILKGYGQRESVITLDKQFEIDCAVYEVLSQRAQARITCCQCGVGCIIVDGEVHLSAILLQSADKNDIIRKDEILPFRAEIDCEDAMPAMFASASVRERSFKSDVSVDGEQGKSLVNALVTLTLVGEAFYSQTVNVVNDAFSVKEEIEFDHEQSEYDQPCQSRAICQDVSGRAGIDELPVGVTLLACCSEKAEIVSTNVTTDECLEITGVLSATAYFKDLDGKVFTRKAETPFNLTLQTGLDASHGYNLQVIAVGGKIKMISATELELFATCCFTLYPYQFKSLTVIKSIKSLGDKKCDDYGLSVYIPIQGEGLWSLAKRLNVRPEQLVETNPDLQFPLSGEERIAIFRQIK